MKICGVTRADDALACVEAGADALGINRWRGSARWCADDAARAIVEAVGERARLVAVTVDATDEELRVIRDELGIAWLQLHGDEPPERVAAWGPRAYKAMSIDTPEACDRARAMPGSELLVDARVPGLVGGTGVHAHWGNAARLSYHRPIWLAGGLKPEDVGAAIQRVRPMGVDVASGVEVAPGLKDPALVRMFVEQTRAAARRLDLP